MILSRLILLVIILQPCCGINAQVPGWENNTGNHQLTRDTTATLKKKISHKYDSLISNCNTQVLALSYNIIALNKQVDGFKQQIKQADADHAVWEKNAGRSLSNEQLQFQKMEKYKALQEKIKEYNNQIDGLKATIRNRQYQIKDLQSEISKLEKDKAISLSKL